MTTAAPFGLYRHVFVDEWTLLIGMALDAGSVAVRHGAHLAKSGGAMNVVTVGTLNQSFVYTMVIGLEKVSLRGRVAPVAEFRLLFGQQMLRLFGMVRGMAIEAADIVVRMCRNGKMSLLVVFGMAAQTASASLLLRQQLKADDFANIA